MLLDSHYCSAVAGARDPKGTLVKISAARGRVDGTWVAMASHTNVKPAAIATHVSTRRGTPRGHVL